MSTETITITKKFAVDVLGALFHTDTFNPEGFERIKQEFAALMRSVPLQPCQQNPCYYPAGCACVTGGVRLPPTPAQPIAPFEAIEHGTLKREAFSDDMFYSAYLAERRDAQPIAPTEPMESFLLGAMRRAVRLLDTSEYSGARRCLQMAVGSDAHVAQPIAVSAPTDDMPTMRASFRTEHSGSDGYWMKFKFQDLAELQQASREWRAARAAAPVSGPSEHARNCSGYDAMQDCTCGAGYRKQIADLTLRLGTETTMHAAWRKRAEEAESAAPVSGQGAKLERFTIPHITSRGDVFYLASDIDSHPRSEDSRAVALICDRCKVDRFKAQCPCPADCAMTATAYGVTPQRNAQLMGVTLASTTPQKGGA